LSAQLAERAMALGTPPAWPEVAQLLECRPNPLNCTPPVTVVVRSTGRHERRRAAALEAARALEYPRLEVRVMPQHATLAEMAAESSGEILVVTDERVTLDPGWVGAAVRVFIGDPEVMAVAGLILPRETAGRLAASLSSALTRRWHRAPLSTLHGTFDDTSAPSVVAYWRPALETPAPGLHTVVYEPAALAWHRSRTVVDPFPAPAPSSASPVVRAVELGDTPRSIADATADHIMRLEVAWEGRRLGAVHIRHEGAILSPFRIQDAIARTLAAELLDARLRLGRTAIRAIVTAELARHVARVGRSDAQGAACPQWRASRPAAA
jgi:hypothetical protein